MSTVRVTYFDRDTVRRALDEYVRAITARHPEIEEVVLFGSLVTGTPVPGSDVDLLIIMSDCNHSFLERIPTFLPSSFPVGMDVFPYTREEIERMVREGNCLVLGAIRGGLTLFTRPGDRRMPLRP